MKRLFVLLFVVMVISLTGCAEYSVGLNKQSINTTPNPTTENVNGEYSEGNKQSINNTPNPTASVRQEKGDNSGEKNVSKNSNKLKADTKSTAGEMPINALACVPISYINVGNFPVVAAFFWYAKYQNNDQVISFSALTKKSLKNVKISCERTDFGYTLDKKTKHSNIPVIDVLPVNSIFYIDSHHGWEFSYGDILTISADGYDDFVFKIPTGYEESNTFDPTKPMQDFNEMLNFNTPESLIDLPDYGEYAGGNAGGYNGSNGYTGSAGGNTESERQFLEDQLNILRQNLADQENSYETSNLEAQKPFIAQNIAQTKRLIAEFEAKISKLN